MIMLLRCLGLVLLFSVLEKAGLGFVSSLAFLVAYISVKNIGEIELWVLVFLGGLLNDLVMMERLGLSSLLLVAVLVVWSYVRKLFEQNEYLAVLLFVGVAFVVKEIVVGNGVEVVGLIGVLLWGVGCRLVLSSIENKQQIRVRR